MHKNTRPPFTSGQTPFKNKTPLHKQFQPIYNGSTRASQAQDRSNSLKYNYKSKENKRTGRLQLNPVPQTISNSHNNNNNNIIIMWPRKTTRHDTILLITKVLHLK